jgi:nitric oxide reductase subunit C
MTTRLARLIFAVGTLSSAVLFGILTADTQRQVGALSNADKLSATVVEGKAVFQKYNCNDCHTILGFGGYYAPDLTRVYGRRGEAYIRSAVSAPETMFASSARHMPQQHLQPREIDALVTFFGWVNEIHNHDWPPQDSRAKGITGVSRLLAAANVSDGAALFKENSCFDCHSLQGAGRDFGPALDEVGNRLSAEQIARQIADPASLNASAKMPAFKGSLSGPQIEAIAGFLAKQKGGK